MDSFVALLGSVWYLVLVAAISPVMILNANAAVHGQKQNHGWAFVSGAGLVLARHVHLGGSRNGYEFHYHSAIHLVESAHRDCRSATRRQNPDAHYLMVDRPHSGMASSRH